MKTSAYCLSGHQLDILYALANGGKLRLRTGKWGKPTDCRMEPDGFVVTRRTAQLLSNMGLVKRSHGYSLGITDKGLLAIARAEKGLLTAHERPVAASTVR